MLVVEQNLRAATSMADRQLVMVSGRIEHETTAAELRDDPSCSSATSASSSAQHHGERENA